MRDIRSGSSGSGGLSTSSWFSRLKKASAERPVTCPPTGASWTPGLSGTSGGA